MSISGMKSKSNGIINSNAWAYCLHPLFIGENLSHHPHTTLQFNIFMELLPFFVVICNKHIA